MYNIIYYSSLILLVSSPWVGLAMLFQRVEVGVALLVLAVSMHLGRRCIRAGCACGPAPRCTEDVLAHFQTAREPVGEGWSFFLRRRRARPVYMNHFRSTSPRRETIGAYEAEWWRSGTTIRVVAKFYRRRNLAFPSLPSIEDISLGAWIKTNSHGSSGDMGRPSNHCFQYIHYLSKTGEVKCRPYPANDIRVVLHVSFHRVFPNFKLHKRAIRIDPERPKEGVRQWLRPSFQRAMFIGKGIVALQWSRDKRVEKEHRDPHCCSRVCLWLQADVFNIACRCSEPVQNYSAEVELYHANRFVPAVWAFPITMLFTCRHRNFEILCLPPEEDFLPTLVEAIHRMHRRIGGRTEIRLSSVLFVDMSLTRNYSDVFRILENVGVRYFSMHKGKYQYRPQTKMIYLSNRELFSKIKKTVPPMVF